MQVSYGDRITVTARSLKFLGLTIDASLTWRHHSIEFTSRLNKACYATRSIKPFMSTDVLRSTYFSYMHSIISYGIIFLGKSSHSEDILKIQKRIVRLIMNSDNKASCRQTFRELISYQSNPNFQYSYLLPKIKTNLYLTLKHIKLIQGKLLICTYL
jgi:hypothetical protein